MKENPIIDGATEIPENMLGSNQVNTSGLKHKLAHLMHYKAKTRPGECQIMKKANKGAKRMWIRQKSTLIRNKPQVWNTWCFSWLKGKHIVLDKEVLRILSSIQK